MYCPNCGKKLERTNQKFCQYCGFNLEKVRRNFQQGNNISNPPIRRTSSGYVPRPVYNRRSHISNRNIPVTYRNVPLPSHQRKKGSPGPFSKSCFYFASIALLLSLCNFIFGSISVFYYHGGEVMYLIKIVILEVFHITGFALAVISLGIRKTVERTEPINNYEQAGLILGIFGIILNVVGAVAVVLSIIPGNPFF
jgi:hypothetical protein